MSHRTHSLVPVIILAATLVVQGLAANHASAQSTTTDILPAGQSLANDQAIVSKNGKYRAVMQKDGGHFAVYETASGKTVWATRVFGGQGWVATMQADGNFVVYDGGKRPKWSSDTYEAVPGEYFLELQDSGELAIYKGTPASPVGVIWSSRAGRRYKHLADATIARIFRPRFKLSDGTRCYGLTFKEPGPLPDWCRKSYDPKFAVFAHVVRPPEGSTSSTDGNNFRIAYSIAFGWQEGTYTGATQAAISLVRDAGNHGDDAQYMVVDVVNGAVTSVWADMHAGYYTRARGELSMRNDHRVIAWVGKYYHPLKLIRETTSVCKPEADGWYGLSDNVTNDGLRFLCAGTCGSSRSCMPTDTILNWGDPSGEDYEADGQLVMVDEACKAGKSYKSPDGETYTNLNAIKGYLGCLNAQPYAAGLWKSSFKSQSVYTNTYGLEGCDRGDASAGSICNATHVGEGKKWVTSRPPNNMYMELVVAGSADVDYKAGTPFSDLEYINGRPRSITFRTGRRVDAVSTTYTDGGIQGHGGSGGSAITMNGLDTDPIVRVELCSAKKNGRVRVGHIKLKTYKGVMKEGGGGYDNCRTIAPYGKMLYGFYGRAGDEIDLLGTYWGDLPSRFPAKETSW